MRKQGTLLGPCSRRYESFPPLNGLEQYEGQAPENKKEKTERKPAQWYVCMHARTSRTEQTSSPVSRKLDQTEKRADAQTGSTVNESGIVATIPHIYVKESYGMYLSTPMYVSKGYRSTHIHTYIHAYCTYYIPPNHGGASTQQSAHQKIGPDPCPRLSFGKPTGRVPATAQ